MKVLHREVPPVHGRTARHALRPDTRGRPSRSGTASLPTTVIRLRGLRRHQHTETPADVRRRRQIEKDERFWVAAALMALYHGESRRTALADLLTRAGAETPGSFADWSAALHGELHLFFEARPTQPTLVP